MRTRVLSLLVCGLTILTGTARADDAEVNSLREEVAALRDKLVKTEVDLKLLQERNNRLEQRIQELEKENERLRKKGAAPDGGGTNPPPANVEGLVNAVDEKSGLVTITVGSDAGLAKGHTLDVYRLTPAPKYLGQIELIDVRASEAVGKPVGKAKDAIAKGDSVSSGVLTPTEEAKWGTVKGQITWDGPVPAAGSEKVVVNAKNKGLKNVFVWLVDAKDPKKALPINPALKAAAKEVTLTIEPAGPARRFVPRALAIRQGQAIVIKNTLNAPEGVQWGGGDDNPGDRRLIPAGKMLDIDDLKASRRPVPFEGIITPSMRAWLRVFDHPYFAVTDDEGKFEIKGAPAGKCHIIIWHEETGWVNAGGNHGQPITIPSGRAVEVNEKAKPVE